MALCVALLFRPSAAEALDAFEAFDALDALAPMDTLHRVLAAPAGFRTHDFDLTVNERGTRPAAPSAVLRLLRNPREADSLVGALRRKIAAHVPDGRKIAAHSPDGRTTAASAFRVRAARPVPSAALWPWLDVVSSPGPEGAADPQGVDAGVPVAYGGGAVGDRLRQGEAHLERFAAALTPGEHAFLRREAPALFRHNAEDTLLTPVEREQARLRAGHVIDTVLGLAARLPLPALADASRAFDDVLESLLAAARADSGTGGFPTLHALLRAWQREGIPVIFGSPDEDVHHLDALLAPRRRGIVFDPGGNDRYILSGTAQPGSWLIILDAAGDDVYHAGAPDDSTAGAAAFASIQLIADLAGDDRYEGGDFAFGSAIAGYSRVYDAAGNDHYRARSASLGFAFYGLGIVHDRDGDDVYSAAFLSQGASSTFGFGLLLDDAGDDTYITRPEFLDDLRYRDRFLSLSQGFSSGFAPHYGGGLAVLWDRAGNDRYVADIYGQGAGYWYAWGILMDDDGHDSLTAWQYAQGAGIHFATGMLLDGGGDDVRVSKGVSQGCGHDGGFGLLVDVAGDDRNTAVDMSAGAGSANGLGVFLDFAGDDVYVMKNPAMTLGHADMRRDRPSMGFFLDLAGRNTYPASPGHSADPDGGPATGLAPEAAAVSGGKVPSRPAGRSGTADVKASGRGAAGMTAPFPRAGTVWQVYDGTRRGHGFGLDRGPDPDSDSDLDRLAPEAPAP